MEDIVYRLIEKKDYDSLAKFIRNVFDEFDLERVGTVYSDELTDHLSDLFDVEGSEYWVAEKSDTIIGGCGLYPTEGLKKDCARLVKFYPLPSEKNQGIGLKLINHVSDRSCALVRKVRI